MVVSNPYTSELCVTKLAGYCLVTNFPAWPLFSGDENWCFTLNMMVMVLSVCSCWQPNWYSRQVTVSLAKTTQLEIGCQWLYTHRGWGSQSAFSLLGLFDSYIIRAAVSPIASKILPCTLSFQQGSESLDTGILHNVMEYMTTTVWTIISDAHSKKYSSL